MVWNANQFRGEMIQVNQYSITIKFHHTNIYGPSAADDKADFINWPYNFDCSGIEDWIIMGDFNLIRSPKNRNRLGGNINDMMLFNAVIHHLDQVEIAFQGISCSWSNMQDNPLLEKLDWVFTSSSWTLQHLDTSVLPLARPISDHVLYVIKIGTNIPKGSVFSFENFWMELSGFMEVVQLHWNLTPFYSNAAKTLSRKFK